MKSIATIIAASTLVSAAMTTVAHAQSDDPQHDRYCRQIVVATCQQQTYPNDQFTSYGQCYQQELAYCETSGNPPEAVAKLIDQAPRTRAPQSRAPEQEPSR